MIQEALGIEIPPGWSLHVYHRSQDQWWTVSLNRPRYARETIIVRATAETLEEALEQVRQKVREMATAGLPTAAIAA